MPMRELEERMADEFMEYTLTEVMDKSLGSGIKHFFRSLLAKIKVWMGMKPHLNQLYKMINDGAFADKGLKEDGLSYSRMMRKEESSEMDRIKEEAVRNGTFMKAPNGKDTNLTERQWLQVRTKAFKEWFGDWEKFARAKRIQDIKPVETVSHSMTKKQLKMEHEKIGSVEKDGRKVLFYSSAFGKNYREGGLFASVVPSLKEVFEKSEFAFSDKDSLEGVVRRDGSVHKGHRNISEFLHYVGKTRINGKDYFVRTTIQAEKSGKTGTHSFFVTNISLYNENTASNQSTLRTVEGRVDIDSITDAKLRMFFESADNSSKIVDENGEPLVVYHGTREEERFSVFDNSKASKTKAIGSSTENSTRFSFFMDDKAQAEEYTTDGSKQGNMYEVFLNIRNPKIINFEGRNWNGKGVTLTFADEFFGDTPVYGENGKTVFPSEGHAWDVARKKYDSFDFSTGRIGEVTTGKSTNEVAEDALAEGYDGVIMNDVNETGMTKNVNDFVIFSPNQVKSATDNIGTFSKENDDIMYRMADDVFNEDGTVKPLNTHPDLDIRSLTIGQRRGILARGYTEESWNIVPSFIVSSVNSTISFIFYANIGIISVLHITPKKKKDPLHSGATRVFFILSTI